MPGAPGGVGGVRGRDVRTTEAPNVSAMPFGSMIMITEPSPRMVLPEKAEMWRSLVAIGFTTISSVWNTPSTTMPNDSIADLRHDDEAAFGFVRRDRSPSRSSLRR